MLLGFKPQFREPILVGTKVFTMRGKRKVQPKIGEVLYMYQGLRTQNCMLISNKERLIGIQSAFVDIDLTAGTQDFLQLMIHIDKKWLSWPQIQQFVQYDGFEDVNGFLMYWTNNGKTKRCAGDLQLFHWTDLKY